MIKAAIITFVLIPTVLFAGLTPGPDQGSSAKDVAEPSQQKQNYKFWKNLLVSYASFRKIAWATLHDLNTVSSIAWTAQSTLQQLETFSSNISAIYKNCQNLSDVNDVVQLIENLETKVFQLTDPIILGGLPSLGNTMKQSNDLRNKFFKNGSATWNAFSDFRKDTEKRYFASKFKAAIGSKISYMEQGDSSNPEIASHALQMSVATRALAAQDNFNRLVDDQSAMISENSQRSKDNEKDNSIMQASVEDRINQRNSYIVGLQFHGQLKDNIDQESMYLLSKTKELDKFVYEMSITNSSAKMFRSIAKEEISKVQR
jgi:hypothetical protein